MPNVVFQVLYKFWNELPDVVRKQVFLPDALADPTEQETTDMAKRA